MSDTDKPKYKYIINDKYENVFDPLSFGYELSNDTVNINRYVDVTDLKTKKIYIYDIMNKKPVLDRTNYNFIEYKTDYIQVAKSLDSNNYKSNVYEVYDLEFNKIDIPTDINMNIKSYNKDNSVILRSNYETKPTKTYLYELPSKKLIIETEGDDSNIELIDDNFYLVKNTSTYNVIDKSGKVIIKDLTSPPQLINLEVPYYSNKNNKTGVKNFLVKTNEFVNVYDTAGKLIYEKYNLNLAIFGTNYLLTKNENENKQLITDCKLITNSGDYDCLKQK